MQPHAGLRARAGDRRDRVDRRGRRRADGGDHGAGVVEAERFGPEAELVVDRRLAKLEPEQPDRAGGCGMRLLRGDDDRAAGMRVTCRRKDGDRRGGRGVLDVAVPFARKSQSSASQPSTTSSSSVSAGDVRQTKPTAFIVAASSSARIPAPSPTSRSTP